MCKTLMNLMMGFDGLISMECVNMNSTLFDQRDNLVVRHKGVGSQEHDFVYIDQIIDFKNQLKNP